MYHIIRTLQRYLRNPTKRKIVVWIVDDEGTAVDIGRHKERHTVKPSHEGGRLGLSPSPSDCPLTTAVTLDKEVGEVAVQVNFVRVFSTTAERKPSLHRDFGTNIQYR